MSPLLSYVQDGVRLYVDSYLLIDNWLDGSGLSTVTGSHTFTNSSLLYEFQFDYRQNTGNSICKLSWSCASCGIANQPIPTTHLFPAVQQIQGSPVVIAVL